VLEFYARQHVDFDITDGCMSVPAVSTICL
jgi:hypothetical protein